ncbi:MAG TPA: flagellar biosynthetic protein FliO [Cellvibrio sp.]|nr:flagellar biosynthetic protein FliO [Cellvibrio sp.]
MQNFAGPHKKSTAGIAFAFGIFFISSFAYSNTTETSVPQSDAASSAAFQAPVANAVDASNSVAQTPVTTNSSFTAPKPALPPQTTSSASQLASLLGGLILILGLIYGLSWFVKRFSQGGFMQNPNMKIISAMPLGTRERLLLVDVGGKQLLLGVTATQINTLHVFDEPVAQAEKSAPIASDFSQKLMAILQQKNVAAPDDTTHKKSNS